MLLEHFNSVSQLRSSPGVIQTLRKDTLTNMLVLEPLLTSANEPGPVVMAKHHSRGELQAVLIGRETKGWCLGGSNPLAACELACEMVALKAGAHYLHGPANIVAPFMQRWNKLGGQSQGLAFRFNFMSADKVMHAPQLPGHFERAKIADLNAVAAGAMAFYATRMNEQHSLEQEKKRVAPTLEDGRVFVWRTPEGTIAGQIEAYKPVAGYQHLGFMYVADGYDDKDYRHALLHGAAQQAASHKHAVTINVNEARVNDVAERERIGFTSAACIHRYDGLKV